jgi:hypothetical protein
VISSAVTCRLDAGIEAFGELAANFREVYAAHLRLKFGPPFDLYFSLGVRLMIKLVAKENVRDLATFTRSVHFHLTYPLILH